MGANFGYFIGFVVAGAALGMGRRHAAPTVNIDRAFIAMAIGDAIVFFIGVTWLKYDFTCPSQRRLPWALRRSSGAN